MSFFLVTSSMGSALFGGVVDGARVASAVRILARLRTGGPGIPRGHAFYEPTGRYVVRHYRARARLRAVAELHRRHQRRMDARVHAVADARLVLVDAVVVRGDRARAEVGARADLRVADVRKVWDLRAGADLGVLDLHERPGLRAVGEPGAGPEVRERADRAVVADLDLARDGVGHDGTLAHHDVDEMRVGTDDRAGRDLRAPFEDRAGQDPHVGL